MAKDFAKTNMILDVNPADTKFYPYAYAENDSLNVIRGRSRAMWDEDLPAVIRKRNSTENKSLVLMTDFYSVPSNDKISWDLANETKIDGQYKLQKATTSFGGRKWIAWFCKEVNLSEGPYKFNGLPGLIFEIEDSKKNYIFKLVKSMKFPKTYETPFLESFIGKKPLSVTEKIIAKKQLELYNDPLHDVAESFKSNTNPDNTFWVAGIQVKSIDQLKGMSDERRRVMLRDNNPIEIDKAVKYPLN